MRCVRIEPSVRNYFFRMTAVSETNPMHWIAQAKFSFMTLYDFLNFPGAVNQNTSKPSRPRFHSSHQLKAKL